MWVAGVLLSAAAGASAQWLPNDFNRGQLCVQRGSEHLLDVRRVATWVIKEGRISDVCLDLNEDGDTLLAEKVRVLGDHQLVTSRAQCASERVDLLAFQSALDRVLGNISGSHLEARRLPRVGEFESNYWYAIETVGDDTAELAAAAPDPQAQERILLPEFLTLDEPHVKVVCDPGRFPERATQQATEGDAQTPSRSTAEDAATEPEPFIESVRLRGTVADLGKPVKRASSATISVSRDQEARQTTYDLDAALGLKLHRRTGAGYLWDNLAFVGINRYEVTGSGSDVSEFSAGLFSQLQFRGLGGHHVLNVRPKFVADTEADTQLGALRVTWAPLLGAAKKNPFISPVRIGAPNAAGNGLLPIWVSFDVEGQLAAGTVFDDGGSAEFSDTNNYLRGGGYLRAQLYGARGSMLRRFTWDTQYSNHVVVSGPFSHVEFFKSNLAFALDAKQSLSLNLSYEKGRKGELLKKVDVWKVGFGLKF